MTTELGGVRYWQRGSLFSNELLTRSPVLSSKVSAAKRFLSLISVNRPIRINNEMLTKFACAPALGNSFALQPGVFVGVETEYKTSVLYSV